MRQLRPGLYQGDFSDFHLFKTVPNDKRKPEEQVDLGIYVGSTAFVPPGLHAIHFPMIDDYPSTMNNWFLLTRLADFAADVVRSGKRVLISCDAGISRSVIFSGMVISLLENRIMDEKLMYELAIGSGNENLLPYPPLWNEAAKEMEKYRSNKPETWRL